MIQGNKVRLEPLTRDMWRTYYHWRMDHEVMYWATGEAHQTSLVPEEAFMRRFDDAVLTDRHRESGILGIVTETDTFIGEVSYRDMDLVAGTAVLGIMIGEKAYWGQGYGTDAIRSLCRFLFDRFRLRRIQLDTWAGNERAIKSYANVGFQMEGRLREATLVNGQPQDQVVMGLLRSEFLVR